MKINPDKLIKISTYAHEKNVSAACVYLWIRDKEINSVTIDGVAFVVKDELSQNKGKWGHLDAPGASSEETKPAIK